jgi:hypothetical protein
MSRTTTHAPKRWPSKEAREIAAAVHRDGGTIELTAKGRLRVTGPAGTAIVSGSPCGSGAGGHALGNALAAIRRETGLRIAPAPPKPSKRRAPKPRAPAATRRGTVTRWVTGEPYGLITDEHGRTWFVPRYDLPEALARLIRHGTAVTFTGSPDTGKPHPETRHIRVEPS